MPNRYWWVIFTYIIMQFSGLLFAPLLHKLYPISEIQAVVYWSIFSFIVGLIIVLYLMRHDLKPSAKPKEAANRQQVILWSVFGVFLSWITQALVSVFEMNVLGISPDSENTKMIMEITRISPFFFIVPAVVAPILEELIFRKIIFGTFYKRTNFFVAAILSSFIFGVIHGEIEHLLIYSSMGFVLAYVYVKTKRIITPIIVHMSLNTISLLAQFFIDPEELEQIMTNIIFFGG